MRARPWLLLALTLDIGLAASGAVLVVGSHDDARGDFVAFYTAWDMVTRGDGARLYDFDAQASAQRRILHGDTFPSGLLPYINPPHAALLLAPLARLPLERARALWTAGQLALVALMLRMVLRRTRGLPTLERAVQCAAVLAAPPLLLTIELGAFSLLMAVSVLALCEALARDDQRAAAACIALGTIKPQLVLPPVLAAAVGRRWRALGLAGAAAVALAVACAAVLGPRIWLDYLRGLWAVHGSFERVGIQPSGMINLKGALLFALGSDVRGVVPALALGGWAIGAAATIWIWRGWWRPAEPSFELRMAATVLAGAFLGLHLYGQDGLMIVVAALLFDSYLRRAGRPRAAFATLVLAAPALWFATELVLTPRLVRFPVLLQLALGAMMVRELHAGRQRSGTT